MKTTSSMFLAKAFTLVELLIVIGIIGLLAVTLLISLNPAEAQRKTRDAKRLKDVATIQSVVEQLIADGGTTTCFTGVTCRSSDAGPIQQQPCTGGAAGNFLGANVCNYAKFIPVDPYNSRTTTCRNAAATSPNCLFGYYFTTDAVAGQPFANYEINVRVESQSNAGKLTTDSGDNPAMYEVFSNLGTLLGAGINP